MVFKVSLYRNGKDDLIKHLKRHNNDISKVSLYCACSAFPIAAAIVFCIEEWPEKQEELEQRLERLKAFYGYDSIER